jgi:hypothetical protein
MESWVLRLERVELADEEIVELMGNTKTRPCVQ